MSVKIADVPRIGRRNDSDNPNGVTGDGQSIVSHESDWKIVTQLRALKDHFGLGSVLSVIAIVIAVSAAVGQQGQINGASTKAIEKLGEDQRDNRAAAEKALAEAFTRLEGSLKTANDLAQQNREDLRSMREDTGRRLGLVEQKADSTWNWMVDLKTRVGQVEIETKKRENREK